MATADNEKRRTFAREYAACGNASEAARRAGVPASSAHSMGYRWLRSPDVLAMIRDELDNGLKALGPASIAVMRDLLADPATPPQVKVSAARDVLDRLGWVPPKRAELAVELSRKSARELSIEELRAIAAGEALTIS